MPLKERLYSRVKVDPVSGCWEWQGSKRNGYGRITIGSRKDGSRKSVCAHRLSYILSKGDIPNGMEVCHKCDNPCCINPDHLFAGTRQDNVDDREAKHRNEEKTMGIKPCPFCGSKDLYVRDNSGHYVACKNCDAYGPYGKDDEEAIRLWNHAPRKEDAEMEKNCANCVHISEEVDGKVYCCEKIDIDRSCKYWEALNPFGDSYHTCAECKHRYYKWDKNDICNYCGHEIGNPEGYVCDNWEAKEPEPAPLTPSNLSSLDELCRAAVEKWGATAQIYKTIEELSELITALARYQNADENSDDAILSAADNVREEREDVEIMLRQLDVIVLRSEEWRRKKYEHLQKITDGD